MIPATTEDFPDLLRGQAISVTHKTGGGLNGFPVYGSMWTRGGSPQGVAPTAPATCHNGLAGCFSLPPRGAGQERALVGGVIRSEFGMDFLVVDRLRHMGGLVANITTAQTVGLSVDASDFDLVARIGNASFDNVLWFLEVNTGVGATGANATLNVTYADNSTGDIVLAVPANIGQCRALLIPPLSNTAGNIKAINTMTLSISTGTAGNVGFFCCVEHAVFPQDETAAQNVFGPEHTGCAPISDNACLQLVIINRNSTHGNLTCGLKWLVA